MGKTDFLLTAAQAKALDKKALKIFGISTLVLMENAGRLIAEEVLTVCKNKQVKVSIFCGTGNNGGDGFCAARHLLAQGIKAKVYLAGKVSAVENEARVNLEIWLKLKQKVIQVRPANLGLIGNSIKKPGLIVDALLGVGARGELKAIYQEIIDLINTSGAYVLAVDIPSGLDASTGNLLGRPVKADKTVTFMAKKRGMVLRDGSKCCGKVVVSKIGLPLKTLLNS